MSSDIQFDDVSRAIAVFGELATLITVTETSSPHVVTAVIGVRDDRLVAEVGSRTSANLRQRPDLTLLWQPVGGGEYQMILDGVVDRIGDPNEHGVSSVSISVARGILHRLAGLPSGAPTCLAVDSVS